VEKRNFLPLPELELRPLGRPARSQSLYRLRYPGFSKEDYGSKRAVSPMIIMMMMTNYRVENISPLDIILSQMAD
jgi:hypothetical protein